MFNRIDSSICCADNFIQNRECRLKGCELNKRLNSFSVNFTSFDNLLTTPSQTRQVEI